MFKCYICHNERPMDFVNSHHKIPKSMGGSEAPDNKVNLCSGCHQDMHVIARMMRNPKRAGDVRSALQADTASRRATFPWGSPSASPRRLSARS